MLHGEMLRDILVFILYNMYNISVEFCDRSVTCRFLVLLVRQFLKEFGKLELVTSSILLLNWISSSF